MANSRLIKMPGTRENIAKKLLDVLIFRKVLKWLPLLKSQLLLKIVKTEPT